MPNIAGQRLYAQQLAAPALKTPAELVTWMGAVQAQDYLGGLWGIGLRLPGTTERDIEAALADKSIVRTSFMRGTLHIVPGADLRWMMRLHAPRLRMLINNGNRTNKTGVEEPMFLKAQEIIQRALEGGKQMTREELNAEIDAANFTLGNLGSLFLLGRAQADGLICYGANRGKQKTFALVEEWLPPAPTFEREAALAEFARRYFVSHGPATVQDYVWWSGLTVADAKFGIAASKSSLASAVIDGQTYWFAPDLPDAPNVPVAHLLPNYDEYTVGYKDRAAAFDPADTAKLPYPVGIVFHYTVMVDGKILATFKRMFRKDTVVLTVNWFVPPTAAQSDAVAQAIERYGQFVGARPVIAQETE